MKSTKAKRAKAGVWECRFGFFLVRSQDVQRLSRLRFWVYMQPGLNL